MSILSDNGAVANGDWTPAIPGLPPISETRYRNSRLLHSDKTAREVQRYDLEKFIEECAKHDLELPTIEDWEKYTKVRVVVPLEPGDVTDIRDDLAKRSKFTHMETFEALVTAGYFGDHETLTVDEIADRQAASREILLGSLARSGEDFGEELRKARNRVKANRQANRELDEEEMTAARGPRPKRTAREFALVPKPDVIMDEVLAAEVCLLGGPSEAGKSLVARDWALHVAAGVPWLGHNVRRPRKVLWIASEGTHDFAERWESQPLWGRAADNIYILGEPINLTSSGDVEWLLEEYADEQPGMVAFDVIYGMGLPDDNGTKDVVPLIGNMKKISAAWGGATVALGHPGLNGARRFRGSSAWRQLAAVEWHMGENTLTCEKSKIANKDGLTRSYQVTYPNVNWLGGGMAGMRSTAEAREQAIRDDIVNFPDSSDSERARRLGGQLGVGDRQAKRLIQSVREANH